MKNVPRWLVVFLLVSVLAVQSARALTEPDGHFVLEAISTLQTNYVDQLEKTSLINVAIGSLEDDLNQVHIKANFRKITNEDSARAENLLLAQFNQAKTLAAGKLTSAQLAFNAVKAVSLSLNDSHVYFLDPLAWEQYKKKMTGRSSYAGIGLMIKKIEGRFFIVDVFAGGPAERAGISNFDEILAVDGKFPHKEMTVAQVVSWIIGPANTQVTLTVKRKIPNLIFVLRRAPITVPAVAAKMDGQVGYVKLRTFLEFGVADKFKNSISELVRSGAKSFVVDVRSNYGGLISELQKISGVFFPRGTTLFRVVDRAKKTYVYEVIGSKEPLLRQEVSVAVLVNEESASCSEILTAAMQEYGRGTIVGSKTAVATDIAMTFSLSFDAAFCITIARVLSPNGNLLGKTGVTPDLVIQPTLIDYENGRDAQYLRAIEAVDP